MNDFSVKDTRRDDEVILRLAIKMKESKDYSAVEYASVSDLRHLIYSFAPPMKLLLRRRRLLILSRQEMRKSVSR